MLVDWISSTTLTTLAASCLCLQILCLWRDGSLQNALCIQVIRVSRRPIRSLVCDVCFLVATNAIYHDMWMTGDMYMYVIHAIWSLDSMTNSQSSDGLWSLLHQAMLPRLLLCLLGLLFIQATCDIHVLVLRGGNIEKCARSTTHHGMKIMTFWIWQIDKWNHDIIWRNQHE